MLFYVDVIHPIDAKFKQKNFVVKGLASLIVKGLQFISSGSFLFYFVQKY